MPLAVTKPGSVHENTWDDHSTYMCFSALFSSEILQQFVGVWIYACLCMSDYFMKSRLILFWRDVGYFFTSSHK